MHKVFQLTYVNFDVIEMEPEYSKGAADGDNGGAFIINSDATDGPRMYGVFENLIQKPGSKAIINAFIYLPSFMEWIEVNKIINCFFDDSCLNCNL